MHLQYLLKKNLHVSRPVPFKPMLSKGEAYLVIGWRLCTSCVPGLSLRTGHWGPTRQMSAPALWRFSLCASCSNVNSSATKRCQMTTAVRVCQPRRQAQLELSKELISQRIFTVTSFFASQKKLYSRAFSKMHHGERSPHKYNTESKSSEIQLLEAAGCSREQALIRWPNFHDWHCVIPSGVTTCTSCWIVRLFQTLKRTLVQ